MKKILTVLSLVFLLGCGTYLASVNDGCSDRQSYTGLKYDWNASTDYGPQGIIMSPILFLSMPFDAVYGAFETR